MILILLKKNIRYEIVKHYFDENEKENNNTDLIKQKIQKHFEHKKIAKMEKIKKIKVQSYDFIIKMIMNKNEYKLITNDLWKVIGFKKEKEEPPIIFSIKNSKLILNFNKKKNFKIFI